MTTTTHPPQILDRSALTARYRTARAAGNDLQATAILAVLKYLDRGSRAAGTSDCTPRYPTVAEQFDALVSLCWWWATPVLTPVLTPERSAPLR